MAENSVNGEGGILKAAVSDSRIITTLKGSWRSSWLRQSGIRLRRAWDAARVRNGWHRTWAILSSAGQHSSLSRTLDMLMRWWRLSFVYRWLTKEPEPEVIVIDLRDTYTVSPFITFLDRVHEGVERSYRKSRVKVVMNRVANQVRVAPIRAGSFFLATLTLVFGLNVLVRSSLNPITLLSILFLLGASAAGTRVDMTLSELVQTRSVRVLIAVFEPPEPPENEATGNTSGGGIGGEPGNDSDN